MNKIILLGYMGSGKSLIAPILARKSGLPFYDLDALIETESGKSIRDIFAEKGEIYFRKLENAVLKSTLKRAENYLLALGGGTPCYADNHLLLKDEGIRSFYLKTSVKELSRRLRPQKAQRPLLADLDDAEIECYIAQSLFERSFYYLQADHVIATDGKTADAIADEILALI